MTTRTLIQTTAVVTLMVSVILSGCAGPPNLSGMSAHDLFEYGKERYEKKKFLSAKEAFESIVYNYPGTSIVDTAQYYLALNYFAFKNFEIAAVEFNRLAMNYPSSVYFEQAIFMRAVSKFEATPKNSGLDQSELDGALKLLEDFVIDFPESEQVVDANKYILIARSRLAKKYFESGMTYSHMGTFKAAIVYFQKVIDDYTDTKYAAVATYQLAEMEFKMKKYAEAADKYNLFATVFPDHEAVSSAREKIIEATFKDAKASLDSKEFDVARGKFEAFIADFPDSDKVSKAQNHLRKIDISQSQATPQKNADS